MAFMVSGYNPHPDLYVLDAGRYCGRPRFCNLQENQAYESGFSQRIYPFVKQTLIFRCCAILYILMAALAVAAPSTYPSIQRLSPRDVLFAQIQDSLAQSYRAEMTASPYPDFFICQWTATGGEELLSVAARLSIPYETLATLNGFSKTRSFRPGEVVLIPSVTGVFVPDVPRNDLDVLLAARQALQSIQTQRVIVMIAGVERQFTLYPGSRLFATERSFFLEIGFRMPLPDSVLTSSYGFRRSPIDGHDRMHEGVDLAAPLGTSVFAARDGSVVAAGEDPVLGLRVIIEHDGGLRTIYGHLSRITVMLNQMVRSGTIVGAVGSTGLSTGPHLHFEIRLSGKARDPSSYLPGLKQ